MGDLLRAGEQMVIKFPVIAAGQSGLCLQVAISSALCCRRPGCLRVVAHAKQDAPSGAMQCSQACKHPMLFLFLPASAAVETILLVLCAECDAAARLSCVLLQLGNETVVCVVGAAAAAASQRSQAAGAAGGGARRTMVLESTLPAIALQ